MERRSPTGIARERETRSNDPTPHANPTWSAGLRPASRGSAKPAPMTVRRTDVSGAPPAQSGLRRSPRCAGRCRPEVGVPLPACRLCSIGIAPSARLRRAVPTGGRRSLAGASSFPRGVRAETSVIRDLGDTPFAALRAAVPTGGRRSLAGASCFPGGVLAETGVIPDLGDTRFRCASRSGADRRSAVPCQWVILSRWGKCRDVRHPGQAERDGATEESDQPRASGRAFGRGGPAGGDTERGVTCAAPAVAGGVSAASDLLSR